MSDGDLAGSAERLLDAYEPPGECTDNGRYSRRVLCTLGYSGHLAGMPNMYYYSMTF